MTNFESIKQNFQKQLEELINAKEEIKKEYDDRISKINSEIAKLTTQRDELRSRASEDLKKLGDMVAAVELILEAGASPSPAENPTPSKASDVIEPAEETKPAKPEKATKSAEPVKQTKLVEPKKTAEPKKTVEAEKPVEPPTGSTPIIWAIDVEPGRYVIKSGRVYDREDGYKQPLASYADKYGEQCVGLEKFDGKGHKTISYRLMHKWLNRPLEYASKADAARRAWRRWCQENGTDVKASAKPAEPEKKQEKSRTETKPETIDYTERRPIVFPEFPELPAGKYTITAAGSVRNEYSGETLTYSGGDSTIKVSLNNSAATKFDPHMGGGSVSKQVSVAKLVWNTFSGKPPIIGRKMFRYLDGNVHNCRIENIMPK